MAMKRSKSVVLTSIMASGGMALAGCDDAAPSGASSTWLNPPAASSQAQAVGGRSYASLQACRDADEVANSECDTAFADAQSQAPKFGDQKSCEERYGVEQCVPRSQAGGGSFFTPLLTGFIVGQALNNFGNRGYYGNQFPAGGFGNAGAYRSRDYVTGRPSRYEAPARVQSRSAVISRGGFGGGGRSFGG
jgi:uncharacterized protein YgiB involved in biofilm formation